MAVREDGVAGNSLHRRRTIGRTLPTGKGDRKRQSSVRLWGCSANGFNAAGVRMSFGNRQIAGGASRNRCWRSSFRMQKFVAALLAASRID
jgi:hypothetical protein